MVKPEKQTPPQPTDESQILEIQGNKVFVHVKDENSGETVRVSANKLVKLISDSVNKSEDE
jgi:hypothetical protein